MKLGPSGSGSRFVQHLSLETSCRSSHTVTPQPSSPLLRSSHKAPMAAPTLRTKNTGTLLGHTNILPQSEEEEKNMLTACGRVKVQYVILTLSVSFTLESKFEDVCSEHHNSNRWFWYSVSWSKFFFNSIKISNLLLVHSFSLISCAAFCCIIFKETFLSSVLLSREICAPQAPPWGQELQEKFMDASYHWLSWVIPATTNYVGVSKQLLTGRSAWIQVKAWDLGSGFGFGGPEVQDLTLLPTTVLLTIRTAWWPIKLQSVLFMWF